MSCSGCPDAKQKKRMLTSLDFDMIAASSCISNAFSMFHLCLYVDTISSISISCLFVANARSMRLSSLLSYICLRRVYVVSLFSTVLSLFILNSCPTVSMSPERMGASAPFTGPLLDANMRYGTFELESVSIS